MSFFRDRMSQIVKRFEFLEAKMGEALPSDVYVKMAAEYASLEELVSNVRALEATEQEKADLEILCEDQSCDPALHALVTEDLLRLTEKISVLSRQIQISLLPKDSADERNVVLEIRAGTGGQEAALFCGDLYRMYEGYATLKRWNFEVISMSAGDVGGFKEIIASVSGQGVFERLKFESGVHRVQRVPETESAGRIHTSAATVAVLPEAQNVDLEISDQDIRIDTMRAAGAGGQHVNTTDSAVRITHLPTGLVVVQAEKSQHQNRARAMQVLRTRLFDMERSKLAQERSESRRLQVGSGDRSQRIRTYNFPQGRVTDHRIGMTLHKLEAILDGEIDEMIDALLADHQSKLLAEIHEDGS